MIQGFDHRSFTKDRIKTRLIRKAAEHWGFGEAEMDLFDPLVEMLMETTAVEFEKVANEISYTHTRLLNSLAGLMVPDVADVPIPATAILSARPVGQEFYVQPQFQFTYKRTSVLGAAMGQQAEEIVFSPAGIFPIYDAAIRAIVNSHGYFAIDSGINKRLVAATDGKQFISPHTIWIGMQFETAIQPDMVFNCYFDWPLEAQKDFLYEQLPYGTWSMNGQPLSAEKGFFHVPTEKKPLLEEAFDINLKTEWETLENYRRCFISFRLPPMPKESTYKASTLPEGLESCFSWQDTKMLKDELVWVALRLPETLSAEQVAGLTCALNCFPVLNRRLHKITYKLPQPLNIVPLQAKESFFAVKELKDNQNRFFRPAGLTSFKEQAIETYLLRQKGVNRFDQRNARELLYFLLEVLRDESAAFAAVGEDFLASLIRELDQNIAKLTKKIGQEQSLQSLAGDSPYLVIKTQSVGTNAFIEYWTTLGETGNKVPAGSKLAATGGSGVFRKEEVVLVLSSNGGTDRPDAEEKLSIYKKHLLTRNRLLTLEDLKVAAEARLGKRATRVEVNKSYTTGKRPGEGFMRCVHISITPAQDRQHSDEDWDRLCHEIANDLSRQASFHIPIKVSKA